MKVEGTLETSLQVFFLEYSSAAMCVGRLFSTVVNRHVMQTFDMCFYSDDSSAT